MSAEPNGYWLPKGGNSDSDYEDAFSIVGNRVAIADGATESSFARAWADALVRGFTCQPGPAEPGSIAEALAPLSGDAAMVERHIVPLQRAWHDSIAWDRLPWFAEDKAKSGAFATLLAFEFVSGAQDGDLCTTAEDNKGTADVCWRATAIGDSCLFQVRDDSLCTAFPIERADDFNSRPVLLSSNPANNGRVWESVAFHSGSAQPGDVFLFATDALAHWFLAEVEAGRQPWRQLCGLQSQADFAVLIARLRGDHAMRNDDVTLVRITTPGGESA